MWRTVKLGDLCEVVTKGTTPTSVGFKFESEGINFVKVESLAADSTFINSKFAKVTSECHEALKRSQLKEGDILFSIAGALGRTAIVTEDILPANTNQALAIVRLKESVEVDKRFLLYVLNSQSTREQSDLNKGGVAQQNLSLTQLKNYAISLPPLAEQQRIVAKLDAAFAEIERAMEVAAEKEKQSGQLADAALDEIANLDGEIVTLAQVCSIEAALVSPTETPYRHQKHIGAGNIISVSNQLVDVMTAEQEKLTSSKYPFDESSVLYSKIRPYLRKVHLPEFEGICSADMYPLVPDRNKMTRQFLFYLLLSNHFTNHAIAGSARAGMPKVNRNHLFAYQFSLPSVMTQKAFAQKMEKILTQTRSLNALYQSQIDKFAALKSAILAQELQPAQDEAA